MKPAHALALRAVNACGRERYGVEGVLDDQPMLVAKSVHSKGAHSL